jgi:hypothetical protein
MAPTRGKKEQKKVFTQPKTVEEWLNAKVLSPSLFKVSPEGMLISPPIESGDIERIIPLESRIPATVKHIEEQFAKRTEEVKLAEENFTEARRSLQRITDAFRKGMASTGDVVIANQQVKEAEAFLLQKAIVNRSINELFPSPEVRDLFLDNRYVTDKIKDMVYKLNRENFPWTYYYENRAEFDNDLIDQKQAQVQVQEQVQEQDQVQVQEQVQEQDQEQTQKAKVGAIIAAKKKKLVLPRSS